MEKKNQKMSIKLNNYYLILISTCKVFLCLALLFGIGGQPLNRLAVQCHKVVTHLNNNNYQRPTNIPIPLQNKQQQQQQQQSTTSTRSSNTNQNSLESEQQFNNNLTAISNRPIERPSLSLVSGPPAAASVSASASSRTTSTSLLASGTKPPTSSNNGNLTIAVPLEDLVESPADWLMMEESDLLTEEGKSIASFASSESSNKSSTRRSGASSVKRKNKGGGNNNNNSSKSIFDDDTNNGDSSASPSESNNEILDDVEEGGGSSLAGNSKEPDCASHGRYYCTYKEEYPLKLVTEVTKYYKWPLEKLFRDLHAQIMPKLAQDSTGNLVCDSITRVVRPGWARNTNERWLVVINTENYHQYVTEVVCQYGSNSRCNFIPPCYYSSCQQRYNTQKLLVIDPSNPYRGPFLSEFLFPSCCVCYVPSASDSFQDKYRSSPATIYQRTMQQESANNLYPPQFKPAGILEDLPASIISQQNDHQSSSSRIQSQQAGIVGQQSSANNNLLSHSLNTNQALTSGLGQKETGGSLVQQTSSMQVPNQAPGPGEIRRRAGELHHRQQQQQQQYHGVNFNNAGEMDSFPRLGSIDSLGVNNQQPTSGSATSQAQQQQ